MFQQLVIRVKTRQFNLYNEYFSFFHSNSINKILTSKKIDQVILYKDLQFYDDQTQYLKRAYYQTQAYNRIKKLISYYQKNMTPPSPILLTVEQYQYLDNRNRKILKLCIIKQKSNGQKQKRKSFVQSNALKGSNTSALVDILPKLQQTNLQNIVDSQRGQSQQQSYDSDVHDVFENYKQKARQLFSNMGDNSIQYRQVLAIRNIKQSQLVINFKTANQPPSDFNNNQNQPKIVISQPPNNFANVLKFSNKSAKQQQNQIIQQQNYQSYQNQHHNQPQTNSFNKPQPINSFSQNNQTNFNQNPNYQSIPPNNMYQKQVQQGPLQQMINGQGYSNNSGLTQKSSSPKKLSNNQQNYQNTIQQNYTGIPSTNNSSNSGNIFSNIINNNQNPGIINFSSQNNTNSNNTNAEKINQQNGINNATSPNNKKGKISFMQYYHSVPVKNPTNILEKYMKRKK